MSIFIILVTVLLIIPFAMLGVIGVATRFTDSLRRHTAEEVDYATHAGLLSLIIAATLAWLMLLLIA